MLCNAIWQVPLHLSNRSLPQLVRRIPAAYCFALSTGCLPAFREFLFKHPEIVNYGSTCTTDESHFTVFINLRKNAVLGLCFSAVVCRLQDGSLRSVSFRSVSEQLGFEQATAFFLSSKLRSWLLKAFKRCALIADELGNCRGDGILMDKCKCCGESQRSDYSDRKCQQVSEEYRCSACLMMERKVIFAISLEAQGEVAKSWETFCSETVSFNVHDNYEVCCVCGCEDNEDLDDLVPCICHSSEAVVHTSCSAACKPFTFVGASRIAGNDVKKPRRSSSDAVQQSEHMPNSEGSSPNHVEINSAVQKEAKEPDCTEIGSVCHLWRSADIPALVPFKKRRIQLSDVQRSPSPPLKPLSSAPHSPVSLPESFSKPISIVPKSCSPKSDNLHSKIAASLFSSSPLTSPKSSSIVQCIPDTTQTVSKLPSTEMASSVSRSSLPRSLSTVNSIPVQLPMLPSLRMSEEAAISMKSPNQESSQICTPQGDRDAPKPSSSQEVEDGEFVISTEKNSIDCDIQDESPEVSSQIGWGQDSQGSRSSAPKAQNDRSGWDLNTNMEAWDPLSDKVVLARLKMGKGSRRVGKVIGQKFNSYDAIANEPLKLCRNELAKGIVGIDPDQISPCKEADAGSVAPVGEIMTAVCEGDGFEKLEADILGPRNSDLEAGNGNGERQGLFRYSAAEQAERYAKKENGTKRAEELEGEEQIDYGVLYNGDGYYEGWDFDDRSLILEDEAYWKGEDASYNPLVWESNARLDGGEGESKGMHLNCSTSGRVKCSGWDQLPEGFESAEEALKAAQEVIARRSCISFGGWRLASLSSHRGNSVFYDIKKSSKCFGNRYLSDSSHSRDIINHTRGLDDSCDDCHPLRGRLRGQTAAAGPHSRGCHKGWAENRKDDFNDEWGHRRHHSMSGFSSQGPTNAAKFAAARAPRRGFVVDHEGTLSRGRMRSEGMRSTFVNSRGLHTAGQVISTDLDGGSNYFRGVSPGVDRSTAKSSKFGFGLGERGIRQGGGTRFAASMSNRHPLPGRGFGDRHQRSLYTSRNLEPRRSESPCGMHLPDHPFVNNCHSPSSRLEPRLKRSRFSPPSPEPFSRSKFYPPSARNQRSPPPSHKWSHDRGEGENFRERDFRRLVPRYKASGRTSPHVVHGSSLMDDRDLQVLAGTRSSSGARGNLGSFRVESPVLRASRRAEEGGCTGSFFNGGDIGDVKGKVYKRERCRDDDKKREP
ncbi:hypothetical protein L7F22_017258 [Adiantum nelumboides]|nr:hypothetical protein [Adiantum nelumboides]